MNTRPVVDVETEADPAAGPAEVPPEMDADSAAWLAALHGSGAAHSEAVRALHELLLRASRFEMSRRRGSLGHLSYGEIEDLAVQAADDACVSVLARLDTFRGLSRFTTWAYKFALYEASVKARRRPGRAARSPWSRSRGRCCPTGPPVRKAARSTASCWPRCSTASSRC